MKEKLELDKYEVGIIINALNVLRNNQLVEEKPTDAIDELLMKLFPIYKKKNKLVKCLRIDNSGRY